MGQIDEFVRKTNRTEFSLREFAETVGVKLESARRYVLEAQRLGVVRLEGDRVVVDRSALVVLKETLGGLKDWESLLRLLNALKERGLVKDVRAKRSESPGGCAEHLEILLGANSDAKEQLQLILSRIKSGSSVLLVVAPSYLIPEIYASLRSAHNLPPDSMVELSCGVKVITIEKA
ncbi:MAG: hypothetical protein QW405_03930 [Fervidicoccaceae archaeon]